MTVASRVLLLEDDASIRRFVTLALANLPIELIQAASIADARQVLAQQPVDLFISDLMLPDGHAMDMFRTVGDPAMRIVIFSAGVSAATREQATDLHVFRVLDKPVPYAELIACVEQALAMPAAEAPTLPSSTGADRFPATQRQRAIDAHFGGQAALFDEFLASCLAQLPADLEAGDRACAAQDASALRRVAHNLKSVLQLIGSTDGHAMARRLEQGAAAGGVFAPLATEWAGVRVHVSALCQRGA